jgi:hypothetical protein
MQGGCIHHTQRGGLQKKKKRQCWKDELCGIKSNWKRSLILNNYPYLLPGTSEDI